MPTRAIEILQKSRQEIIDKCERELKEIDTAISQLSSEVSGKPKQLPTVKPGQYKAYKAAVAAQMYLKDAGGGPVSFRQLAQDLKRGGCQPEWSAERYDRNLKIMFSNGENKDIFSYDEGTDEVSLRGRGLRLA